MEQSASTTGSLDLMKVLVHTLTLEDGTEIHMLAERKYPLTKETLEGMMSLKLIAESASESAYNLLSHQELASPEKTASGKDFSNPLMADSLPKTILGSTNSICKNTQNAIVQDTSSSAQQDAMIMSVFEHMSNQVTNCNKIDLENKLVNESLTTKLERYKERVKTFEERLNIDLSSHEKLIDSQMDDIILNRNAVKQEIDSLKQTFSKQVKEKESLLQTFTIFKKESKEKRK
ncbi:hypothetical protein Tco_0865910 [Tanacetum coccineum]